MKSSTQFDDQVIVVAQFDGNTLQLQDDGLYKLGYHHLQEVSMENCLLLTVPPRFFSYLKLRKINLRRNMLKEIRSDIFSELDQLTSLDLSFNTLTHIDQVFEATDFVTKYSILHVQDAFISLDSLQELNLANNKLRTLILPQLVKPGLDTRLLRSLKHLNLENNPWRCDCELGPLYHDLETRSLSLGNSYF